MGEVRGSDLRRMVLDAGVCYLEASCPYHLKALSLLRSLAYFLVRPTG
jgi:hypothetical protein